MSITATAPQVVDLVTAPGDFVEAVELLRQARQEVNRLREQNMTAANNSLALTSFKAQVRDLVIEQDHDLTDDDDANRFLERLGLEPLIRSYEVRATGTVTATWTIEAKDEYDAVQKFREGSWWDFSLSTADDSDVEFDRDSAEAELLLSY